MKVLLIDKESKWLSNFRKALEEHFLVDYSPTGHEGCSLASLINYDLIIVGQYLNDIPESEVCQMIRRENLKTPIMVLISTKNTARKVSCLESGADVYVPRSFCTEEFLARTRALIRRSAGTSIQSRLEISGLVINIECRQVFKDKTEIYLRRKEYEILEYLAKNKKRVISREKLILQVWPDDTEVTVNCIDVHISHLRKKLAYVESANLLKTVRGFGYKIDY